MGRKCGFRWPQKPITACGLPVQTPMQDPHEGLSAFQVELDRPGVTRGDIKGKMGVRAGSTGWIAMQDVRIPVDNRIGEEGEGFRIAMSCLDNGRYTVAAGATGLIRASL